MQARADDFGSAPPFVVGDTRPRLAVRAVRISAGDRLVHRSRDWCVAVDRSARDLVRVPDRSRDAPRRPVVRDDRTGSTRRARRRAHRRGVSPAVDRLRLGEAAARGIPRPTVVARSVARVDHPADRDDYVLDRGELVGRWPRRRRRRRRSHRRSSRHHRTTHEPFRRPILGCSADASDGAGHAGTPGGGGSRTT